MMTSNVLAQVMRAVLAPADTKSSGTRDGGWVPPLDPRGRIFSLDQFSLLGFGPLSAQARPWANPTLGKRSPGEREAITKCV
jgi:hypothetical protein